MTTLDPSNFKATDSSVNVATQFENIPWFYTTGCHYSAPNVAFSGITCLNCNYAGYTRNQRIGTTIEMQDIRIKFQLWSALGAGVDQNWSGACRILIVYDKHTNNIPPVLTDILYGNGLAAGSRFNSQLNLNNVSRYEILQDTVFLLDTSHQRSHNIDWHFKGHWPTLYSNSTQTIADITSGSIYLIAYGDTWIGDPVFLLGSFNSRILFYDK